MIIDTCINATLILGGVYLVMAIASSAIRYQPPIKVSESISEYEPQDNKGLSNEDKWEILGAMTLTHLRKLAIAYNASNPTERIARAARLRRDEVIPALVSRWDALNIDVEIKGIG